MTVRVISLVVFGCWLCSIESLPASTGDRGFLDIGIFHPVRYRLNETTVLSTHPLLFPLNPNVGLDRVFIERARSALGTRHAIDYPTPLISLLSRSGPGGIYPADISVPQIFLIRNAVYARRSFERIAIELELGLRLGFSYGTAKLPTLDLFYFYPRTAAIQHGQVYDAGLNLRIPLSKLTIQLDQKLFLVADRRTIFHFENYSYLALALSEKVFFDCGGMYLWGTFDYGSDHIVLPYGDFRIIF